MIPEPEQPGVSSQPKGTLKIGPWRPRVDELAAAPTHETEYDEDDIDERQPPPPRTADEVAPNDEW